MLHILVMIFCCWHERLSEDPIVLKMSDSAVSTAACNLCNVESSHGSNLKTHMNMHKNIKIKFGSEWVTVQILVVHVSHSPGQNVQIFKKSQAIPLKKSFRIISSSRVLMNEEAQSHLKDPEKWKWYEGKVI